MDADPTRPEPGPCPCCLGSGSGIYNALSPKSTCEACDGSGLRDVPRRDALESIATGGRPWTTSR